MRCPALTRDGLKFLSGVWIGTAGRGMMSPAERSKVLLFSALFFGALGFLFTLLSCGTEYWLLAAESCSRAGADRGGGRGPEDVKVLPTVRFRCRKQVFIFCRSVKMIFGPGHPAVS